MTDAASDITNGEKKPLVVKDNSNLIKRRCITDLMAVSFVNMFILTAFNTLRDIETSLNRDVGIISLGCFNLGIVASTVLSPLLFNKLKPKWVLSLACVFHMVFVLSHFHATIYVLVPCFTSLGLFFGPAISATGMYITKLSIRYAAANKLESHASTLSIFNGIYFAFQQSAYVWGNTLSSVLLFQVDTETNHMNGTDTNCGVHFCPHVSILPDVRPVETHAIHILLIVLFSSDVLGFLIATCVLGNLEDNKRFPPIGSVQDPVAIDGNLVASLRRTTQEPVPVDGDFAASLRRIFRLTCHWRLVLIIPLFLVTGVGMVLVVGSFPLAFVTCGLGMQWVGYVMVTMGLCNMGAALLGGVVGKCTGQMAVFVIGACLLLALDLMLFLGHFTADNLHLFFIAAAVWGATDGLYQSQTGNIIGAIFPSQSKEGFVNWVLFLSIARASTFGISIFGCMYTQMAVYTVVTGIATICLVALYVKTGFRPEQESSS